VFAGAGIVQGSDPLKEWEELEAKIVAFYRILS
jgi:isochorismate synthase EntC